LHTKYLFLGGPWDKQTRRANGQPTYYVADIKSASLTTDYASDIAAYVPDMQQHVYYLKKFNIFERIRSIYVYQGYPETDAVRQVGELMSALFDIFVEA